jgi:hypothetical protein
MKLWLMLGELKDLSAPRRGFKAVIKTSRLCRSR